MTSPDVPEAPRARRRTAAAGTGTVAFVEFVRLAVVVVATAAAVQATSRIIAEPNSRLLLTALGAGIGYVVGGVFGRFVIGRIDDIEARLRAVSAGELLAGTLGGFVGLVVALGLVWPALLFGGKVYTLPVAALVVVVCVGTGLRIGAARGGDLLRFLGASGRLPSVTGGQGSSFKVIDTSALIDGRLLDVCRGGFIDGTLLVPQFVLFELQGLADSADDDRRRRGKRGMDVLAALQRSSGASLTVTEDDPVDVAEVDAKLLAVAKRRKAALVTVDGNLARIAEVQGVRVLNLHRLAEDLRPPVLPGEQLRVRITKPGKEPGQGVGYLADGTMVVVEGARGRLGNDVTAEVTSILANPNGRMVFGSMLEPPHLVEGSGRA